MSNNDEMMNEEQLEQSAELPQEENQEKKDWKKTVFKDFRDILVTVCCFMLIYVVFFRSVVVVGSSMKDTLVNGDRLLLISTVLYTEPKQGDVIVASKASFKDGEPIVKRVIAVGGQTVDIDFETGTVYVDGQALEESYISSPTTNDMGTQFPLTVPEGSLFVMGDNRGSSLDSRSPQIGLVSQREIIGKVILLMIPGTGTKDDPVPFDLTRIGVVK